MDSNRQIRNGFMALCVSIANKLQAKNETGGEPDLDIINYLDSVNDWKDFVQGELSASNEKNKKTLGGSVNRNNDDEDDKDDTNYDV